MPITKENIDANIWAEKINNVIGNYERININIPNKYDLSNESYMLEKIYRIGKKMKKKKDVLFFVIIMALYQFPLRFSGYSSVTFLYVYFIPLLYLMWNLSWTIKFIKKISASLIGISIILYGGL